MKANDLKCVESDEQDVKVWKIWRADGTQGATAIFHANGILEVLPVSGGQVIQMTQPNLPYAKTHAQSMAATLFRRHNIG